MPPGFPDLHGILQLLRGQLDLQVEKFLLLGDQVLFQLFDAQFTDFFWLHETPPNSARDRYLVFTGSLWEANSKASLATSAGHPLNQNRILPGLTTATQ